MSPSPLDVLRVAFDGAALTSPAGGVRRYAAELFGALGAMAEVEVTAVAGAVDAPVPIGVRSWRPGAASGNNLIRAATLPQTLRRVPYDVFHAPAYTAPLWGGQPLVLTIHDVVYARHPEWYPGRLDPVRLAFFRRSALRAIHIITDSSFSRDEIGLAYGIDAERISVVPLAAAACFAPNVATARRPVVLHVGDLHPRRNLPLLLDVVLELRRQQAFRDLALVLVGTDRGVLASLRDQAATAGAPDALQYQAAVSDMALARWYQTATVFAYPSQYEGFGVPLLEAMQCGLPVVASRAGSIPEVVGEAALLVTADDRQAWTEALRAILEGEALFQMLATAGLARARQFSWAATARQTLEAYRRARGDAR